MLSVALLTSSSSVIGHPVSSSAKGPSYSIAAYCSRVSNAAGQSFVVESGCGDHERQALAHSTHRAVPKPGYELL